MTDNQRIYMDSCCFIDMVKTEVGIRLGNEREQDVWFLKQLLEASRDGEVTTYTSSLAIAECTHVGEESIKPEVKANFTRLLMSGQYVRLVQPTPFIAEDARDLRWKHGISVRGVDGMHISSALAMRCDEFITTDGQLKKMNARDRLASMGLRMIRACDTECLPSKYRQLPLPEAKNGRKK